MHAFIAQYGYYVGKWKILDIVDEGVNNKTDTLLEYWAFFFAKSVDKAWYLLE